MSARDVDRDGDGNIYGDVVSGAEGMLYLSRAEVNIPESDVVEHAAMAGHRPGRGDTQGVRTQS